MYVIVVLRLLLNNQSNKYRYSYLHTHTLIFHSFSQLFWKGGRGVECGEIMKNNAYFYMCICETCRRFYQEMASQTIDPLFPTQLVILLGGRLCRFTINLQIK